MSSGSAAALIGVPLDEYEVRKAAGQKWCTRCKTWHQITAFGSDASRGDGLSTRCNGTAESVAAPELVAIERAPIDLAYLAGVIDSDGYIGAGISVSTRYVGATVGVTGSRREPHDLAVELFGGTVTSHHPTGDRERHKVQFAWQRSGRQSVPVIEAVLPYLRVKVEQARAALELQERVEEWREQKRMDDPYPWFTCDYDPFEAIAEFARNEVQALNGSRSRTHDEFLPAVTP